MSAAGSRWARTKDAETSAQRALVQELGYRHDAATGKCVVSSQELRAFCGHISSRTFFSTITALIAKGWIQKKVVQENGHPINSYLLCGLAEFVKPGEVCQVVSPDFQETEVRENHWCKKALVTNVTSDKCDQCTSHKCDQCTSHKCDYSYIEQRNNREIQSVGASDEKLPKKEATPAVIASQTQIAEKESDFLFADSELHKPEKQPKPEKTKRQTAPKVPFPETIPNDWYEIARQIRTDVDPERVYMKMRARYIGTSIKKTMAVWLREFRSWIGREFVTNNGAGYVKRFEPERFDDDYYKDTMNPDGTAKW